jgi:hypothetical protein
MKYALKYIHVNYKHHKIPNNENCSYFDGYMKAIEEISKKLG